MKDKTKNMVNVALMSAILCIFGPVVIQIGPIPFSLTPFAVFLIAYIFGAKRSSYAVLLYLLIGGIGLPVFSGFEGGVAKILGPSGGYLASFVIVAFIAGYGVDKFYDNIIMQFIFILISLLVCYIIGTVYFMYLTKANLIKALTLCVYPFVPFDICKIILAMVIGKTVKKRLENLGFVNCNNKIESKII